MEYVALKYDGRSYNYADASNIAMNNVGNFLATDVGCYWPTFKTWALDDSQDSTNSNITSLEKKNGNIILTDLYSLEEVPTECIIPIKQFVQLLDDWENKVCKTRPEEVIIKDENGEFIIEINND